MSKAVTLRFEPYPQGITIESSFDCGDWWDLVQWSEGEPSWHRRQFLMESDR